jgi:hypothetical protein
MSTREPAYLAAEKGVLRVSVLRNGNAREFSGNLPLPGIAKTPQVAQPYPEEAHRAFAIRLFKADPDLAATVMQREIPGAEGAAGPSIPGGSRPCHAFP